MSYMKRNSRKRENVKNLMSNAKSVISCGINYNTDNKYSTEINERNRGWIARYAWGDDYHLSIKNKLSELENFIQDILITM